LADFVELDIEAGGSSGSGSGGGGAGGGLGYKNNYAVTPGSSYTVVVGAGGAASTGAAQRGFSGGTSYFVSMGTVRRIDERPSAGCDSRS